MIKIEVDGPTGKCETEFCGVGQQLLVEATIVLGCILVHFERTGLPIEVAATELGKNLPETISEVREKMKLR